MSVYPAALPTVRPAVRSAFKQGSGGGAASIIAGLFAQGQQGFWLPFTDFASLSQDSAGTLPYTALEQPVGRVLDRSGRGNNASQVTSTARGVVSARVNLLTNSEFTGFVAGSPGAIPTGWSNGTNTGAISSDSGSIRITNITGQRTFIYQLPVLQGNVEYRARLKCFIHSGILYSSNILGSNTVAPATAAYYLNGVLTDNFTQLPVGVLFTLEWRFMYAAAGPYRVGAGVGIGGNVVGDVTLFSIDCVTESQASLPYQRVTTPTYYDAVGFPKFLCLDGTDDSYTCDGGGSTTGFYYSDVVRPMGGAGTRRVIWSDRSGNNGYELAINASGKLEFSAGNGTAITTLASANVAPLAVGLPFEVVDDLTNLIIKIDGQAAVTIARPVVTAGSSTITLYRGASTGYFNGNITEPIYRVGAPPSAIERATIMGYQKQKAGL